MKLKQIIYGIGFALVATSVAFAEIAVTFQVTADSNRSFNRHRPIFFTINSNPQVRAGTIHGNPAVLNAASVTSSIQQVLASGVAVPNTRFTLPKPLIACQLQKTNAGVSIRVNLRYNVDTQEWVVSNVIPFQCQQIPLGSQQINTNQANQANFFNFN